MSAQNKPASPKNENRDKHNDRIGVNIVGCKLHGFAEGKNGIIGLVIITALFLSMIVIISLFNH